MESGRYRNNSNDISFRALYTSEKIQISNSIAYSLTNVPRNDVSNALTYSDTMLPATESFTKSSSKDWALKYSGEYFFMLSKQAGLKFDANYTYGHNDLNSDYTAHNDLSIINDAKEYIHKLSVYLHLNWNPDKANQFFTNFGVQHDWNTINYYGNSPSEQKYDVGIYFLGQNYKHVFNNRWNVGASLAWIWETNRISGVGKPRLG